MADEAINDLRGAAERMRGVLNDPLATPAAEPEQQQEEQQAAPVEEPQEHAEPEQAEQEDSPEQEESEPVEELADATEEGAEQEAESIELGAEDLASILGLDTDKVLVDDEGKISFKGQVDGQEIDANLSDLLNAYQRDANLTNRSKQIAELEKQRVNEIQQFQTLATQQAQQAAITLEAINNDYMSEFNSIDWAGLKAEDPGAWSAKTVEMQQRKANLDSLVTTTLQQINDQQKVVDVQNAELTKQRLISEQGKLQDGFKALKVKVDDDTQSATIGYLTNQFEDSEMEHLIDHRILLMAYKAEQFDKGRAGAESKLVKNKPKVLKKGKSPTKQTVKLNEETKLKTNLKKSGSVDDAAALLKTRLAK